MQQDGKMEQLELLFHARAQTCPGCVLNIIAERVESVAVTDLCGELAGYRVHC